MPLYNKFSKEDLKKRLAENPKERMTVSFYKYAKISDPASFRDELYRRWESLEVLGRTYVANEGINAQISLPLEKRESFIEDLYKIDFLNGCRLNWAIEEKDDSFIKLKIKVRDKIVADGLNDKTFDVTKGGVHVNADEFNALSEDEDTVIVDMRNHYETEIGHFEKAITPDVDTFRDSLPIIEEILEDKKDKNILMYCTGGIRCEKASAYFKHKGFEKVFQLNGGIIEYTRQVSEKKLENKFRGKNFVFDERLSETITNEVISSCHQCGEPADTHTNCKNLACNLLFIQCPNCAEIHEGCCGNTCMEINRLPIDQQKELRKGKAVKERFFKKGRKLKG